MDLLVVKDYEQRVLRLKLNFFYSDASLQKQYYQSGSYSQNDG